MEEAVVSTPSARLAVRRRGTGRLLVLLHGGPGAYDYLSEAVLGDWLAATGAVVGYDQRGCRQSKSDGPFTVQANVADLEAVRRWSGGDRIILIGHSWGGLLALNYAASYTDRVAGLVLIGSIGPRGGWESAFHETLERRHTDAQRRELARLDGAIARTREWAGRQELYRQRFEAALPSYLSPRHRAVPIEMASYSRRVNVETTADVQRTCYADSLWQAGLSALTCSVGLIHGRHDPVPLDCARDIRDQLPAALLTTLDDCGHFPWQETPSACRTALTRLLDGMR